MAAWRFPPRFCPRASRLRWPDGPFRHGVQQPSEVVCTFESAPDRPLPTDPDGPRSARSTAKAGCVAGSRSACSARWRGPNMVNSVSPSKVCLSGGWRAGLPAPDLRSLRVPRAADEVPFVVSAQMTAEPIEQRAIRGRVSAQAGQHQRLQPWLGTLHARCYLVRRIRSPVTGMERKIWRACADRPSNAWR